MKRREVILRFVFTVYFSKLDIHLAAKLWRYYPTTSFDHGYINTRTKFILEYTGGAEWSHNSWYSDEHCHVENKTSPSAAVICSTSGYHPFGILDQSLTKLDLENVLVIKSSNCYEWKIGLVSFPLNSSLSTFNLKFQLWIQKTDEIGKSNSSPLETSKHITKLFYQIGQRPSILAFVSHSSDQIKFVRQEVVFSANESLWEVDLSLETNELLKIKVDESTVGFLDCFIKASVFEIHNRKFSIAGHLNVTQRHYENQDGGLELIQNDCSPNVFIVIRKDHLLLTEDYFDTELTLTVPGHLLNVNPTGYKAVFTRQGNLIIHTGPETFIVNRNSSEISSAQGLPMSEFKFSSYPWCHQDNLPDKKMDDTVLAWANQSSVYLSLNTTIGFNSVNVPSYFQDQGFRLLDVKINGICHCIFYLIESSTCPECNSTRIIGYTTQDYETNSWSNVTLLVVDEQHIDNGPNWSFQFLPPNSLSILLWNSRDVFYKSAEEQNTTRVVTKGSASWSTDKNILQVGTSNNGEYLVLYEDHSLCYGRVGVDYMIKLNASFPDDAQIRFIFDLIGKAYVVSLNNSSPSEIRKNFALDNEIFNAVYPDVYCPFIQFSFGNLSSSNVLDRWEQFEFWGYLVYTRSYLNDIELIWNPTEDLLLTVSERKDYYQDVIMLNKTFTFKERKGENSTFTTSSSFSVTIFPKLNSMTCRRPFHKVFHFHTGCPPTRRAFIRDARWSEGLFSEEQETFSLKLSSDEMFHLAVVMYDVNVLIEKVFSTFDIVELNARTDFAVRIEQSSNGNRTIMSFDSSGSFRFSLSFEDKNVSFCKTHLEFDVYVNEESVTNYFYVEFSCVTFITILLIIFLVFDYLWYRKAFLRRHEADDEAKNRLQELQYLAQLQYYRADTAAKPSPSLTSAMASEDTKRRAGLVTGKKDRGNRRSSVFERVSQGIFQNLKVQERSKSLQDPLPEVEDNLPSTSRRNTIAQ